MSKSIRTKIVYVLFTLLFVLVTSLAFTNFTQVATYAQEDVLIEQIDVTGIAPVFDQSMPTIIEEDDITSNPEGSVEQVLNDGIKWYKCNSYDGDVPVWEEVSVTVCVPKFENGYKYKVQITFTAKEGYYFGSYDTCCSADGVIASQISEDVDHTSTITFECIFQDIVYGQQITKVELNYTKPEIGDDIPTDFSSFITVTPANSVTIANTSCVELTSTLRAVTGKYGFDEYRVYVAITAKDGYGFSDAEYYVNGEKVTAFAWEDLRTPVLDYTFHTEGKITNLTVNFDKDNQSLKATTNYATDLDMDSTVTYWCLNAASEYQECTLEDILKENNGQYKISFDFATNEYMTLDNPHIRLLDDRPEFLQEASGSLTKYEGGARIDVEYVLNKTLIHLDKLNVTEPSCGAIITDRVSYDITTDGIPTLSVDFKVYKKSDKDAWELYTESAYSVGYYKLEFVLTIDDDYKSIYTFEDQTSCNVGDSYATATRVDKSTLVVTTLEYKNDYHDNKVDIIFNKTPTAGEDALHTWDCSIDSLSDNIELFGMTWKKLNTTAEGYEKITTFSYGHFKVEIVVVINYYKREFYHIDDKTNYYVNGNKATYQSTDSDGYVTIAYEIDITQGEYASFIVNFPGVANGMLFPTTSDITTETEGSPLQKVYYQYYTGEGYAPVPEIEYAKGVNGRKYKVTLTYKCMGDRISENTTLIIRGGEDAKFVSYDATLKQVEIEFYCTGKYIVKTMEFKTSDFLYNSSVATIGNTTLTTDPKDAEELYGLSLKYSATGEENSYETYNESTYKLGYYILTLNWKNKLSSYRVSDLGDITINGNEHTNSYYMKDTSGKETEYGLTTYAFEIKILPIAKIAIETPEIAYGKDVPTVFNVTMTTSPVANSAEIYQFSIYYSETGEEGSYEKYDKNVFYLGYYSLRFGWQELLDAYRIDDSSCILINGDEAFKTYHFKDTDLTETKYGVTEYRVEVGKTFIESADISTLELKLGASVDNAHPKNITIVTNPQGAIVKQYVTSTVLYSETGEDLTYSEYEGETFELGFYELSIAIIHSEMYTFSDNTIIKINGLDAYTAYYLAHYDTEYLIKFRFEITKEFITNIDITTLNLKIGENVTNISSSNLVVVTNPQDALDLRQLTCAVHYSETGEDLTYSDYDSKTFKVGFYEVDIKAVHGDIYTISSNTIVKINGDYAYRVYYLSDGVTTYEHTFMIKYRFEITKEFITNIDITTLNLKIGEDVSNADAKNYKIVTNPQGAIVQQYVSCAVHYSETGEDSTYSSYNGETFRVGYYELDITVIHSDMYTITDNTIVKINGEDDYMTYYLLHYDTEFIIKYRFEITKEFITSIEITTRDLKYGRDVSNADARYYKIVTNPQGAIVQQYVSCAVHYSETGEELTYTRYSGETFGPGYYELDIAVIQSDIYTITGNTIVKINGEDDYMTYYLLHYDTEFIIKYRFEIDDAPYTPSDNDIVKTNDKDSVSVDKDTAKSEGLDATDVFNEAKEDGKAVEVKVEELSIVFDSSAVSAIGGNGVTLKVNTITVDEEIPVTDAKLVIEISLEGATFENGKAQLEIPFEEDVPEGKVAKVYYIDANGNKTDMNATFENGKVVFSTNHFSTYAVVFEDANNAKSGCGSTISTNSIATSLVLIAAFLTITALYSVRRKQDR